MRRNGTGMRTEMNAMGRALICAAAVVLVAFPGTAQAAPPPNDMRANADEIQVGDFLHANNVEATVNPAGEALTASGDTNGCQAGGTAGPGGNQIDKTVWWHVVGNGEPLTISTKLSDFDTVAAVYTQGATGLIFQGCNDDAGPDDLGSELVVDAEDGTDYWIQVGGCDQCATKDAGNISLSLDEPPANDQRSGARTVSLGTGVDDFTFGALTDAG